MGKRAYPGDPDASANSARAWQDMLQSRGARTERASGVFDADTKAALKDLREELKLGPKSAWKTVWAHSQGLLVADVVDEGSSDPDAGSGEAGAPPPA